MKQLREIIYKTLVEHLGVSRSLLTRVESSDPVCIELLNGSEIYVILVETILRMYIDIPIKDRRLLKKKSNTIIDCLCDDEDFVLSIRKNKILLCAELEATIRDVEKKLADKLDAFNELSNKMNDAESQEAPRQQSTQLGASNKLRSRLGASQTQKRIENRPRNRG